MFTKSLAAAAVLSALAGAACAASVSVYGLLDEGLKYQHSSVTGFDGVKSSSNTFVQDSGIDSDSLFGFKGEEELGNGWSVSFVLESGFLGDDGTLDNNGGIFNREASVSVSGPFGTLSAGRMGGLAAAAGSYDVVYAVGDSLDGGGTDVFGLQGSDRYDNMIAYQTPKFAGVQATAQYSFKKDNSSEEDAGVEGKASADRYLGFAVTGEYGAFQAVAAYEREMFGDYTEGGNIDAKNTFYLGGNYDFGTVRVFAMGQYFTGARSHGFDGMDFSLVRNYFPEQISDADYGEGLDGYGLHLGAQIPAGSGTALAGLYWSHADTDDMALGGTANALKVKSDYYGAVVRYEYPLSERTTLYTGVEYGWQKVKAEYSGAAAVPDNETKQNVTDVYFGLTHAF